MLQSNNRIQTISGFSAVLFVQNASQVKFFFCFQASQEFQARRHGKKATE